MKTSRLVATLLLVVLCTGFFSCDKNDITKEEQNKDIEKYTTLLYGSWYREVNSELSKTFMSYKFSSNNSVVRYTKSASRTKSTINGNITYSEWIVNNEYSTSGSWYIEHRDGLNYLKIQWNGNYFYAGYLISYLDDNLLNFDDGFNSDLNKGEKSPNF